jgi:hypothetical protein
MQNDKMNEEMLNELNLDGSIQAIDRIMKVWRELKITDNQAFKLLNMNEEKPPRL